MKIFKKGRLKSIIVVALTMLSLVLLLQASSVTAPAPLIGLIMSGDACYFEVSGVAHVNISKCMAFPHEPFYSNFSNNFVIQAKFSISYQTDQVILEGFDQLRNITRWLTNITEVNITQIDWGNGSLQNLSNFTFALYPKNFTEWVPLSRLTFNYDGRSWEGVTITLPSKATAQYRITLAPKQYGGTINYGILANASGLYAELKG